MRKQIIWVVGGLLLAAPASAAQAGAVPTWNQDVAPIVFSNCITCHRPGEVAPMSLLTYQDARPWARGIKTKVLAHEMPPWFADPRYGKFNNKRGLTQAQIDTLVAWADAGAPQGTGVTPVAPDFGERSAELINRAPDAIVEMPVEIDIDPVQVYPFFILWGRHPFAEDKYVEAVELRPSNRAVTHHSFISAAPLPSGAHHIGAGPAWPGGPPLNAVPVREDGSLLTDRSADTEEATANTSRGAASIFGDLMTFYAPGTGSLKFQPGLAKMIKRDDFLNWQLHYNTTGRPEKDRHSARLWFAKDARVLAKGGLANEVNLYEGTELIGQNVQRENIPPFVENYRVASLGTITSDSTLNSVWPHMHLRGKDMTYSVTYPDGREEILLSVPKYSFEWQLQYQFDQAIKLPAGSILRVVAHYDNSPNNKFNPSPDQELPWGSQSWHEMYFPWMDLAVDKDVLTPKPQGVN